MKKKMLKHQACHRMLGDVLAMDKTNMKFPPRPSNVAATQQTTITTQNENNTITAAAALAATAAWMATSAKSKQGIEAKGTLDAAHWAWKFSCIE